MIPALNTEAFLVRRSASVEALRGVVVSSFVISLGIISFGLSFDGCFLSASVIFGRVSRVGREGEVFFEGFDICRTILGPKENHSVLQENLKLTWRSGIVSFHG